jgi:hypothetical protein
LVVAVSIASETGFLKWEKRDGARMAGNEIGGSNGGAKRFLLQNKITYSIITYNNVIRSYNNGRGCEHQE